MKPEDLQKRTKEFAVRIMKLSAMLEKLPLGRLIGHQIFRSGTSVAANYRSACKSKSTRDFIAKLGIVIEEADETVFWLELLCESDMVASRNSAIRNQRNKD